MSKRKLLLADDSITIQKVVNLTFADEGIEVISVGDGDSAMRKFDEFMPDLVMADVNMPGLSGYEVCRIIKRTDETRDIPVILLVGSFEPFDEAEAKEVGADDYLTKPFQSIRQLVNKVTDLLNQRAQSATDTAYMENPPPSAVDTFAETLEFEKQPDEQSSAPEFQEIGSEFGDAGMDDEMIETSPANEYLSASEAAYRADTDFGKTQPLNAEDLKGFDIVPVPSSEQEAASSYETIEPVAPRAEAASFDEEARKLGYDQPEEQENREVISETEPEIDYYLPEGGEDERQEFEPQVTDAETLEPEIAYTPEEPREADFSQSPVEDESDATTLESIDTAEAPISESDAPILEFDENFLPVTHETESAPEEEATEPAPEEETTQSAQNEYTDYPNTEKTDETAAEESSADQDYQETPAAETYYDETPRDESSFEQPSPSAASYDESPLTESDYDQTPQADEIEDSETAIEDSDAVEAEAESDAAETAESEPATTPTETDAEAPISTGTAAPSFANFDDGDLLELPPLVEETGIRPQPKPEPVASPEPVETEAETETTAETEESATPPSDAALTSAFPPELIEAIAQKVAEQISAKTMRDVLPQITELVLKKLAEEKSEENK